ncbi:3-deoxy-manno-octulosonate cytidylyltransferase [Shimia sp. R11_0]|uniref:3-deoxy-manno-octulosonate cytidylyltransferase n=1 Tax=Shimia sp. R11_0 TaxID=2821096 RepID=UPI001AD9D239|nr:3-deoxy-manno-octulosonate cytidylyltransferase [Shimia sp. R11_0]MBO9479411.1 3-deoxy-manno-octulosonate cytidylyltransferase [Shimia sp. R11_0]
MKTCILIPARYASTRYPGKPLVALTGKDGTSKTLVQRSWERACAVSDVEAVFVTTDDDRIRDHAQTFGAEVIMTSESCENGTERCAEAYQNLGQSFDLVVNFQGDAPMTPAWFVEDLIAAMATRSDVDVATPVLQCDAETYAHFVQDRKEGRVGGTTAVFATDKTALYFSKEVVPYADADKVQSPHSSVYHHVGLYAYRPSALLNYPTLTRGPLESLEGLEQLRFLENRNTILCVPVDSHGQLFWELNNPIDVQRMEEHL